MGHVLSGINTALPTAACGGRGRLTAAFAPFLSILQILNLHDFLEIQVKFILDTFKWTVRTCPIHLALSAFPVPRGSHLHLLLEHSVVQGKPRLLEPGPSPARPPNLLSVPAFWPALDTPQWDPPSGAFRVGLLSLGIMWQVHPGCSRWPGGPSLRPRGLPSCGGSTVFLGAWVGLGPVFTFAHKRVKSTYTM